LAESLGQKVPRAFPQAGLEQFPGGWVAQSALFYEESIGTRKIANSHRCLLIIDVQALGERVSPRFLTGGARNGRCKARICSRLFSRTTGSNPLAAVQRP